MSEPQSNYGGPAHPGFLFVLNDAVRISCSQEAGHIVGRAQYSNSENQYLIRYQKANGEAVERWWGESALELVQDSEKEVD
jgi:hypothetical protein